MKERVKYKVDGKLFDRLSDAKEYRRQIKAGLPNDAVITIFKSESIGFEQVMWVPIA